MKKIASFHIYFSILILFVSIMTAIKFKIPIFYGIIVSILYVLIISCLYEYNFISLLKISKKSFLTVKNVILMLTLLGLTIPLWMAIGTIPTLISLGFKYLSKTNVVLSAFLLCSVLSLMLGSFIGTLSTLSPVFIGLAIGMNIPLPLVVGAIVSGAVFGDRTSPISSNVSLNASSCDSPVTENLKAMLKTTIPSYSITAIFYYILGQKYILKDIIGPDISKYIFLIENNFVTKFYVFIPVIVLFSLILIFKKSIVNSLFISFLISSLIFILQFQNLSDLFKTIILGFSSNEILIRSIINGSGLISMVNVLLLIYFSNYLNDLFKETNLIDPLLEKFSGKITNFKALIYKTTFLSIVVTLISCNQSLTNIITGNHFKAIYEKNNISKAILARTIADTGSLVIPLIPWNANALVVVSLTGISTSLYFKYTFFSFLPLLITLIYPFFINKEYILSIERA